jgi:rhodanese-related sulfurtransferase
MKTEQIDGTPINVLTPAEARERFDRNEIVLIDVRTPAEYAFDHIHGALLFPLASFSPAKLPGQDQKPIVFHCGSGMRSHKILEICAAAGISPLAHMEGGFGAWKSEGLPHITTDPATGTMVDKP